MKISDEMIEEAAQKCEADDHWSTKSFSYGARFAQDKLLEQASEGFEEWYKTDCHKSMNGRDAWTAAKLSSAKEIEELQEARQSDEFHKARWHETSEENAFLKTAIKNHVAHNKELEKQLAEAKEVIGFYADANNCVVNPEFDDAEDFKTMSGGLRMSGKRARTYMEKYGVKE